MQLDVDIEPTLRFPYMTSIDKQMDESEGSFFPVHGGIACTCILMSELFLAPQTNKPSQNHPLAPCQTAYDKNKHDETQLLQVNIRWQHLITGALCKQHELHSHYNKIEQVNKTNFPQSVVTLPISQAKNLVFFSQLWQC